MNKDIHKHAENIACNTESWQAVGYRYTQEDRFIIAAAGHGTIAAVMDGHGGAEAADMVAGTLVGDFTHEFRRLYGVDNRNWFTINEERMIVRRTIAKLVKRCRQIEAGTTLSLVYTHSIIRVNANEPMMRTHIATLGDSPVSILNRGRTTVMPVHSARHHMRDINRINERVRDISRIRRKQERALTTRERPIVSAEVRDGYVVMTPGDPLYRRGLAMTRAIGDADFGDLLIRTPDVRTYDLPIDAVILIASDGIEDDGLPEPIKDQCKWILNRLKSGDHISSIGNRLSPSHDNITMLAIKFSEVPTRWR